MNSTSTFFKLAIVVLLIAVQLTSKESNASSQAYCSPTFANGCALWSNQSIVLDSINWSLVDCSISDYTSMSTTLHPGDSAAMTVINGHWCGCAVWIDFNQDEQFDSTENLFHMYVGGDPSYTYNFYITIPPGVTPGSYRMRVIGAWGSDGYTVGSGNGWGACGSYQYGNFDDFTVNIAPSCFVSALANDTLVCEGDSVTLSGIGTNMTYAWDHGVTDGTSFIATSTTTYFLTATDISNGCIATDSVLVTVNPAPPVSVISPDDTVCTTQSAIALSLVPSGGNLAGPGIIQPTNFFFAQDANIGNNLITYQITDGNGCSNTDSINIYVEVCTGIGEERNLTELQVYPNPATDYFDVDLASSAGTTQLKIYNMDARLILEQSVVGNENRISLRDFSEGVYSVQLQNESGISIGKIVVLK